MPHQTLWTLGLAADLINEVRNQKVNDILTAVIYAGHLESKHWGISLRPAQHEGLISLETWQKNQTRLKEGAYVPARKNLNEDFPLRGAVCCGECGHPMTASWSKGRMSRHAYDMCFKKGCASYRKSIRRETLEGEFEELLQSVQPVEGFVALLRKMFKDIWEHRLTTQKARQAKIKKDVQKLSGQIEQLMDRILESDSSSVIIAYEKRIATLECKKLILEEKAATMSKPLRGYDESVRTALAFLANPWKLWKSEYLEDKRAVLKLVFAGRLAYARNEGFRTAETTLPFKVLEGLNSVENRMAEREGFEPSLRANVNTISSRALSTAQPPLRANARRMLPQVATWRVLLVPSQQIVVSKSTSQPSGKSCATIHT